jgi:hypothetical protein
VSCRRPLGQAFRRPRGRPSRPPRLTHVNGGAHVGRRPSERQQRPRCHVHEAPRTGGIGGEIAATIAEEAFEYLDGPLVRVASLDTTVPYSPPLEAAFMPGVEQVLEKARWLAGY